MMYLRRKMMMRLAGSVGLLTLVASCLLSGEAAAYPKTACGSAPSHNLLLGNRSYGDKLLYSGTEHIDSSILRVKSRDFEWPLHSQGQSREVISRLEVVDKMKDGKGGCAFLASGGPGSHTVKLHLKTQRGGEADFHITIYGK